MYSTRPTAVKGKPRNPGRAGRGRPRQRAPGRTGTRTATPRRRGSSQPRRCGAQLVLTLDGGGIFAAITKGGISSAPTRTSVRVAICAAAAVCPVPSRAAYTSAARAAAATAFTAPASDQASPWRASAAGRHVSGLEPSRLAVSTIHSRSSCRTRLYTVVPWAAHMFRSIRYSPGIIFVDTVRRFSRSHRACLSRGNPFSSMLFLFHILFHILSKFPVKVPRPRTGVSQVSCNLP